MTVQGQTFLWISTSSPPLTPVRRKRGRNRSWQQRWDGIRGCYPPIECFAQGPVVPATASVPGSLAIPENHSSSFQEGNRHKDLGGSRDEDAQLRVLRRIRPSPGPRGQALPLYLRPTPHPKGPAASPRVAGGRGGRTCVDLAAAAAGAAPPPRRRRRRRGRCPAHPRARPSRG